MQIKTSHLLEWLFSERQRIVQCQQGCGEKDNHHTPLEET